MLSSSAQRTLLEKHAANSPKSVRSRANGEELKPVNKAHRKPLFISGLETLVMAEETLRDIGE